jgi:hypothetical protein
MFVLLAVCLPSPLFGTVGYTRVCTPSHPPFYSFTSAVASNFLLSCYSPFLVCRVASQGGLGVLKTELLTLVLRAALPVLLSFYFRSPF